MPILQKIGIPVNPEKVQLMRGKLNFTFEEHLAGDRALKAAVFAFQPDDPAHPGNA